MNKKQSNKMREMKDSGIEWIGEIPSDWKLERSQWHLEEVNISNNPIQTNNVLSLTNKLGVVPYEEKGNQGNKSKENVYEYKLAYPNTIVANSMNILIGSVGLCDYFGCVSPVYYVFRAKKYNNIKFLNYVFQTVGFQRELRKYANGILEIRLRVSSSDILKRFIPFPSEIEQQRIAEFLDRECGKIDGLKADIQAQIDTLEQYKRSIITEAVTHGLNPSAPMKDSGAGWMPLIPLHWKADKLKFHLRQRGIKNQIDKQVLSLYREYGIVPKDSRDDNHNVTSEDVSDYRYVRVGDFVVNKMKAWQGSVAVSNYEGIVSPAYFVYEFSDDLINKRYFHYLMRNKTYATEFRRLSGGIREGQWDLPSEALNNTIILLPPLDEQQEIADYLDNKCAEIEQIIADKKSQIETLDVYKKSLIYEYVTGKKEVV